MSSSSTRYTARFQLPELLERGRDELVRCEVYRSGQLQTPTSGTLTVKDASGNTVVSAQAVTVSASVAQYTIANATTSALDFEMGWSFEWRLLMGDSVTHLFRNSGGLVRARLYPTITDRDVHRRLRSLNTTLPDSITARTTFQDDIDEADVELQNRLIEAGRRPQLIATPTALRNVWLCLTIALVFESLASQNEAQYGPVAATWRQRYEKAFNDATPQLDYNEDGVVEEPEKRQGLAHPVRWLC